MTENVERKKSSDLDLCILFAKRTLNALKHRRNKIASDSYSKFDYFLTNVAINKLYETYLEHLIKLNKYEWIDHRIFDMKKIRRIRHSMVHYYIDSEDYLVIAYAESTLDRQLSYLLTLKRNKRKWRQTQWKKQKTIDRKYLYIALFAFAAFIFAITIRPFSSSKTIEYSSNDRNETILLADSYDTALKDRKILESFDDVKDELDYSQSESNLLSMQEKQSDVENTKFLIRKNINRRNANIIRISDVKYSFIVQNVKDGTSLSLTKKPTNKDYQLVNRKYSIKQSKSAFSGRTTYTLYVTDYAETSGLGLDEDDMFN